MEKPQFDHDCEHCNFAGRFTDFTGTQPTVDGYVCHATGKTVVIARYSDEPWDNGSWDMESMRWVKQWSLPYRIFWSYMHPDKITAPVDWITFPGEHVFE